MLRKCLVSSLVCRRVRSVAMAMMSTFLSLRGAGNAMKANPTVNCVETCLSIYYTRNSRGLEKGKVKKALSPAPEASFLCSSTPVVVSTTRLASVGTESVAQVGGWLTGLLLIAIRPGTASQSPTTAIVHSTEVRAHGVVTCRVILHGVAARK